MRAECGCSHVVVSLARERAWSQGLLRLRGERRGRVARSDLVIARWVRTRERREERGERREEREERVRHRRCRAVVSTSSSRSGWGRRRQTKGDGYPSRRYHCVVRGG